MGRQVKNAGNSNQDPSLAAIEWGDADDRDLDDPDAWAHANPPRDTPTHRDVLAKAWSLLRGDRNLATTTGATDPDRPDTDSDA
jgi:hypothetical protein